MAQAVRVQVPPSAPNYLSLFPPCWKKLSRHGVSVIFQGPRCFRDSRRPHRPTRRTYSDLDIKELSVGHCKPYGSTVQDQQRRPVHMQFLQPDGQTTCTLPLRIMEFQSERSCFLSLDLLSVNQPSEPSVHAVMAHSESCRRHPYSAISRGHCTYQGVVP